MTEVTLSCPAAPLPEESASALRAFLEEQRYDIVAAYHVVENYPANGDSGASSQETVMFELRDPPDLYAGRPLFAAVREELPPHVRFHDRDGFGFTFLTKRLIPQARAATEPLWTRDPAARRLVPARVEFEYAPPAVPEDFVTALRRELARWEDVCSAYVVMERLLKDGSELSSRVQFTLEGRVDSREASRQLRDSVSDVIRGWFAGFSMGIHPEGESNLEARRNGLLLYQRAAKR